MSEAHLRNKVEAVHIDGGQDQTRHENHKTKGETTQAIYRGLLGLKGKHQLLLSKKIKIKHHY